MSRTPPPIAETARRLEWAMLPPALRALIGNRCGSPVVLAESQTRGFTPGFASVLECEDGSRHFVKAASLRAQRVFAEAYREEARKLAALPDAVSAPRLRWVHDEEWVVLETEYVAGRHPARPWNRHDLDVCLDALATISEVTTPPPADLALSDVGAEFAPFLGHWEAVRATAADLPELPLLATHLDDAVALADGHGAVMAGDTLVHTDVRDDNVLLDEHGAAWLCDWNWPARGAAWLDSLLLLIGPRGDGLDVDAVIAERPLLSEVPAEHIDTVIALVTGYFLKSAADPVPPTSPLIRVHQRWQGEVCWEWLCERRGWTAS